MFQAKELQFGGRDIIMNSSRVWKMLWQCYGRNKSWVAELILEIMWSQWSALKGGMGLYSFMTSSFRCGHKRRGSGTKFTILTGAEHRRHTPRHVGTHGEDSWASLGSRKQGLGKGFGWIYYFFFSYWSFVGKAREEKVNCLGLAKFEHS